MTCVDLLHSNGAPALSVQRYQLLCTDMSMESFSRHELMTGMTLLEKHLCIYMAKVYMTVKRCCTNSPKAGCVFCLKKPVEVGDKALKVAFMCFQPGVRTLTGPPGGGCISHWLTGSKRTRNVEFTEFTAPGCVHRDLMTAYSPCTTSQHWPIKTESIVRRGISQN